MLTIGGYIGQKYFVEVLFCWAVGAPPTIKQGVECTDGIFYYSIVGYVSEADFSSDSVRGMAIQSAALSMIGLFFNVPILTSNIYIFSIVSWLA